EIVALVDSLSPIAAREARAGGEAEAFGVVGRDHERRRAGVDAEPARVWKLAERREQQAAAARAEIEDRERRRAVREELQRRLDQGLAVGARVEHGRRDAKVETPEFARAEDARDGLAGLRAPAQEILDPLPIARLDGAVLG